VDALARTSTQTRALCAIVRDTPWLWEVLLAVREASLPDGYVAAGAVRDTVWDALCGGASTGPYADVDVVYFSRDEEAAGEERHRRRLAALRPDVPWEVTNQATVHAWHAARGRGVAPHLDVADALGSWPETATAVAVRLDAAGALEVLSPLGLDDLFALTARHNPRLAGVETFRQRVRSKRWRERWPALRCVPPV